MRRFRRGFALLLVLALITGCMAHAEVTVEVMPEATASATIMYESMWLAMRGDGTSNFIENANDRAFFAAYFVCDLGMVEEIGFSADMATDLPLVYLTTLNSTEDIVVAYMFYPDKGKVWVCQYWPALKKFTAESHEVASKAVDYLNALSAEGTINKYFAVSQFGFLNALSTIAGVN